VAFSRGERRSWEYHEGHVLASADGYDAIECEICAFIHVVPLPAAEELKKYYATSFYEESKPDYLENAVRDREWLNIGYDAKLDMIEETLNLDPKTSAARPQILDIGSGPGYFLLRAKERGWDVVGLEAAPAAVEFAQGMGLEVQQGYFKGVDEWGLGMFDAIHMQHVLEHVLDPHQLLMSIRDMLKPGAALCIEVPNDFSVIQEILVTGMSFPAWWVAPPEHLNYFSRDSLDSLLQSSGHYSECWTTEFPIDLLLLAGINYIDTPTFGASAHARRKEAELALAKHGKAELLREIYSSLIKL
jgi:SAM-dependent methyltransferase